MTKQAFWQLIDSCRNSDTDAFYAALETNLAKEDARDFRAYLGAYVENIVDCVWLDMACKVINGYVSDDISMYFALWVLGQGEQALLAALKDPDSLADLPEIPFGEAEFERIIGVGLMKAGFNIEEAKYDDNDIPVAMSAASAEADAALLQKCSTEIAPDIQFKNGDKMGGFSSLEEAIEAIPETLPKLAKRAEQQAFAWQN